MRLTLPLASNLQEIRALTHARLATVDVKDTENWVAVGC